MEWVCVLRHNCRAAAARLRAGSLSRGGRYTPDNVVPACGSCNTSKCNDQATGWLRRKRLDERDFLLRHLELRTELGLQFLAEPDAQLAAPPGGAVLVMLRSGNARLQ